MQEGDKKPVKMKFKDALKKGIIKTEWHAYWMEQELLWFKKLGANRDKFRIRQHLKDEKSHYALDTWDLEYEFPFGWKELQGIANRTDFDLKQHEKFSKKDMSIIEERDGKQERLVPHVGCEPSQGVERAFLVFMFDAYTYDKKRENVVLKLHPKLAPYKVAIFPLLSNRNDLVKESKKIFDILKEDFNCFYDEGGSIGRRYARMDEVGAPYCVTFDVDSLKDKKVTIRNRDDTKQIRIKVKDLKDVIRKLLNNEVKFEKAGKIVK